MARVRASIGSPRTAGSLSLCPARWMAGRLLLDVCGHELSAGYTTNNNRDWRQAMQPSSRPDALGRPAITPSLNTDDLTLPAFTADDVRAYMSGPSPFPHAAQHQPIVAVDVTFTTAGLVPKILTGGMVSMENRDRILCIVSLLGREAVGYENSTAPTITDTVCVLFDARTGNLLHTYTPHQPPPPDTAGERVPRKPTPQAPTTAAEAVPPEEPARLEAVSKHVPDNLAGLHRHDSSHR